MSIPFDVLMKGPEAVAAWLVDQDDHNERRAQKLIERILAVCDALGIAKDRKDCKPLTIEDFGIAIAACAHVAAVISLASADGFRGPARDGLSEVIDGAFDNIEEVQEIRALFEALRKRKP